ncbi:hypothetical protein KUTeg_008874 [Tegillarca granosa]|uniref:Uncharacterized protein n=1 Tax=Tegillarca granosa TaxID=220873 RepID=A0ABQ9FAB2_TEGGR|nr:hypothetical protein KUTeg_008874 [Tegillarca granosa]
MAEELEDADLDFPEVNLKALYDYSYQDDDGHMVTMKQGEEYLLLQKYDDWWEVIRKDADTNELSFFVPSNYVAIIPDEKDSVDSSVKLTTDSGSNLNNASSSEGTQDLNKDDSHKNKIQGNDDNVNKSMAAGPQNYEPEPDYENTDDCIIQNAESNKNPTGRLRRCFSDEGDYVNLDKYREESGISTQNSGDAEENSGDGLYANLESLQSSQPPLPEYGQYIKTLLEVWDMYIHPETRRTFYVNRDTNERTYKPPRHPNKSQQL